jgi:hypothetical protein
MSAHAFDGGGTNLGEGPTLSVFDLQRWPSCLVFGADPDNWDGTADLIVLIGDEAMLPNDVLAQLVAASDRGAVFAVHARDDHTLREALSASFAWMGGGRG